MIAIVQVPHAPVSSVRKKHFCDMRQCTIKKLCIWTRRVFSCSKADTTTICPIIVVDGVTHEVGNFQEAQLDQHAYSIPLPLNEGIPTSVWVCFTFPTVIVKEEPNQNNSICVKKGTCWAVLSELAL